MKIINGEALSVLKKMEDESVNCVITSPPYWGLRDYGVKGQLGLEKTFKEYINKLCDIFDEVKRVLKKDGTCWVNLGDTYNNTAMGSADKSTVGNNKNPEIQKQMKKKVFLKDMPAKCLCQIPSRFAIEMCNRGWILRNEIIWRKPNCMPSSAADRFTVDYEAMFFFVKNQKYYFEQQIEKYDEQSISRAARRGKSENEKFDPACKANANSLARKREMIPNKNGRNKRCVWKINTASFKGGHFAVFPPKLVETPIKAGCPKNGIVLDIFCGAGTTGVVAKKLNRKFIGIELNSEYIKLASERIRYTIDGKGLDRWIK